MVSVTTVPDWHRDSEMKLMVIQVHSEETAPGLLERVLTQARLQYGDALWRGIAGPQTGPYFIYTPRIIQGLQMYARYLFRVESVFISKPVCGKYEFGANITSTLAVIKEA